MYASLKSSRPVGPFVFFVSSWFHCLLVVVSFAAAGDQKPTLFIVGDSTVKNSTRGQQGWGEELIKLFDPAKITVENHAIGGRSSRTFQSERALGPDSDGRPSRVILF